MSSIYCGLSFNGDESDFRHVYSHELGHALGFWHVDERGSVMHPGDYQNVTFTQQEMQHMQLACRAGRSHPRGNGGYPLLKPEDSPAIRRPPQGRIIVYD